MVQPPLGTCIIYKRNFEHKRLQPRAYSGIARVISNHAYSYHEDRARRHVDSICVLMHAQTYPLTTYSLVTKYASPIVHQMQHSQVLPGYPHSSAGPYSLEAFCSVNQVL